MKWEIILLDIILLAAAAGLGLFVWDRLERQYHFEAEMTAAAVLRNRGANEQTLKRVIAETVSEVRPRWERPSAVAWSVMCTLLLVRLISDVVRQAVRRARQERVVLAELVPPGLVDAP